MTIRRAVARALNGGGGGGGDVYSYIRVVPDEFLLKRKEFKNHIKGTRSPFERCD